MIFVPDAEGVTAGLAQLGGRLRHRLGVVPAAGRQARLRRRASRLPASCKPRKPIDAITTRGLNLLAEATGRVVDQLRQADRLAKDADTDAAHRACTTVGCSSASCPSSRTGDAVVFLDLDHFKNLNDTLGHVAGDRELAAFGAVLREQVREGDVAARYGGEEFADDRPRQRQGTARRCWRQRLRDAWDRHSTTTFSVGAALHERGRSAGRRPWRRPTARCTQRRQAGRDRMCWADGPEAYGPTVQVPLFGWRRRQRHRREEDVAGA